MSLPGEKGQSCALSRSCQKLCADDLRPPFRSLFDACYARRVALEMALRVTAGAAASFLAISALTAFGLLEGVAEGISLHNWWRHPVRGVALTSRAHAAPPSIPQPESRPCALFAPCALARARTRRRCRFAAHPLGFS